MDYPNEDTIRILITTDNHVGYNENDPITGDDSWKTFHEIMMLAKSNNVDMVLQAGDLFHVNKPSKKSMYQVMKSLRLACMGDKPCELELLSDPSKVFYYNEFTNVNYEDPNFNVSIPVFAIAGNHDDATGEGLLCPMDLLQVCGLVNHFGKVLEADQIQVMPLLFQKGNTKLALYGMASVRDERLFRTFKEGNVTFEVPAMREGEWFNLMCVHQNHTGHTNTAFLPEQFLPDFLNMVIWGHEHECIPHLVHNPTRNFDVLQPGSSVATSLCDAEANTKNVFILELQHNTPPKLIPIPLSSVRTFVMRSLSLQEVEHLRPHDKEGINKFLVQQVEEMIYEANEETKKKLGDDYDENDEEMKAQLPLPLIRLRVDYSGPGNAQSMIDYQVENPRRFSNTFVGRVANGNTVIQFYKKKRTNNAISKKHNNATVNDADIERLLHERGGELEVQTLINDLLNKMQLSLLPEVGMNEAVKKFVDKDEKSALKEFIDHEIDNEVDILVSNKGFLETDNPDQIKNLIIQVKKANSGSNTLNEMAAAQNISSREVLSPEIDTSDVYDEDLVLSEEDDDKRKKHPQSTRKRSSSRKKQGPPKDKEPIILSDHEAPYVHDLSFKEGDNIITMSDDDDDDQSGTTISKLSSLPRKEKSKFSSTVGSKTSGKRSKATRTPKTDILSSLLARKRK